MEILLDSALAFLSCIGLWTLGKMCWEHIFSDYKDCAEDLFMKDETSGWM